MNSTKIMKTITLLLALTIGICLSAQPGRKVSLSAEWYFRPLETFRHIPVDRVEVVFGGIDSFGKICLNRQLAGRCDNLLLWTLT